MISLAYRALRDGREWNTTGVVPQSLLQSSNDGVSQHIFFGGAVD